MRELLAPLHDATTAIAVAAERGVMKALEGDCRTPIGAYATLNEGSLFLRAFAAEPDGSRHRAGERRISTPSSEVDAEALGLELGRSLR